MAKDRKSPRKRNYLILNNLVATRTATEAPGMKKGPHATQVVAKLYLVFTTATYSANQTQNAQD